MAEKKNVFRARKVEVDFVQNAVLVDSRQAVKKSTGQVFDVAIFDDPKYGRQEILFPDGWEPRGFDVEFGKAYDCGWIDGDVPGKHLFRCRPVEWNQQ